MKNAKLYLGLIVIVIALSILVTGLFSSEIPNDEALVVKTIAASEAPSDTTIFWSNVIYFGGWALKLGSLILLTYLSILYWERKCR